MAETSFFFRHHHLLPFVHPKDIRSSAPSPAQFLTSITPETPQGCSTYQKLCFFFLNLLISSEHSSAIHFHPQNPQIHPGFPTTTPPPRSLMQSLGSPFHCSAVLRELCFVSIMTFNPLTSSPSLPAPLPLYLLPHST